ncbi:hypothetical protein DFH09DRAFT_1336140 [Mycena vulgaris]|nr:hypothetical protein DFH09DRAFT_1336140 [Mycena vulgaris]
MRPATRSGPKEGEYGILSPNEFHVFPSPGTLDNNVQTADYRAVTADIYTQHAVGQQQHPDSALYTRFDYISQGASVSYGTALCTLIGQLSLESLALPRTRPKCSPDLLARPAAVLQPIPLDFTSTSNGKLDLPCANGARRIEVEAGANTGATCELSDSHGQPCTCIWTRDADSVQIGVEYLNAPRASTAQAADWQITLRPSLLFANRSRS